MALKELLKKTFSWPWNSVLNSQLQWVEVHISPEKRSELTMRCHAHLRAYGIRCKLVRLNPGSAHGIDTHEKWEVFILSADGKKRPASETV